MPHRDEDDVPWEDEDDEDLDAPDLDTPDLDDDDDSEHTAPCPSCRREIFEDSPNCPHCGHYLTTEDVASGSKPLWVVITAIVCLVVAVWLAFAV
ncbi:MAG: DUF983 domain-containing protein [Planctomycetaceae bacterium]